MVSHPLPKNVPPNLKDILWEYHSIEVPIFEWKNKKYIQLLEDEKLLFFFELMENLKNGDKRGQGAHYDQSTATTW